MSKEIQRDPVARIMAAGAVVVGMCGVLIAAENRDAITQMGQGARENMIGDCINEDIIREMYGQDTLSLEECIQEREVWRQVFEEATSGQKPTVEPTPTPAPDNTPIPNQSSM